MATEILNGEAAVAEGTALGPRRRNTNPGYLTRLAEAATLVNRAFNGNARAMLDLREAMSTSDFPHLFGDVLDRELLAQYQNLAPIWPQFAARSLVRDFRPKKYFDLLGGRGVLDKVPQLGEYKARKMSDAEYELAVGKYGNRLPLSWETLINDDLDAFRDAPQRIAQGARDTEDYLATGLIASSAGPNTAFFADHGTFDNSVKHVVLDTDALSAALTDISSRRDSEGRPIMVSAAVLMVPPALEVAANNILNATEIRNTVDGQTVLVGNWLSGRVKVVVNPWLPVVDTSANSATSWYLLPAPSTARPGLVVGFLRGHETPDLRVKADAGQMVGGGAIPAEEGSFDNDDIQYRVRHVLGGTTLDPIASYASDGKPA
ncbi:MAG: Mu-like prophage major head subunit gpT family protein [Streptosporangiales bacterium]|nr:Mu-like prophage major head subunit gpT family protein [Streptosporangiales bacterium]